MSTIELFNILNSDNKVNALNFKKICNYNAKNFQEKVWQTDNNRVIISDDFSKIKFVKNLCES